ncbi:hypothetical protein [Nonomuraea jabiensis]|uniref:hypothetical protein n=1 Tax=Nonomuraea jabiensis TaxID=882448 RepID=UPI003D71C106
MTTKLAGYRAALAGHRLPHDPALEVEGSVMDRGEGHRMMRERLDTPRCGHVMLRTHIIVRDSVRPLVR